MRKKPIPFQCRGRKSVAPFLAASLIFWAVFLNSAPALSAGTAAREKYPIGEQFSGEVLEYEVGFWLIDPLGSGRAVFQNLGNGRFLVVHEGRAEGFAGWLSGGRREIHRCLMATINDGGRLIPLNFEHESIVAGEQRRKKTTVYDYAAGKIYIETHRPGEKTVREEMEIPYGTLYDSPVTAFYNFRYGVYGRVEPGKEIRIQTVPGKMRVIHLQLAGTEETERRRAAEPQKEGKDLFMRLQIDREFLGSGQLEVWLNKELIPVAGTVKAMPVVGNINGKLKHREFIIPGKLRVSPLNPALYRSSRRELSISGVMGSLWNMRLSSL